MSLVRSTRRRDAVAYRAALRGTSTYNRPARRLRVTTTVVALVLAALSARAWLAVSLVLVALAGPVLNYLMLVYHQGYLRRNRVLRLVADSTDRTEGRQQLNLPAYVELVGLVTLIATFSYVTVDLPTTIRLVGLMCAVAYASSVAHGIYGDHTWFNPAETHPPRWHELLRTLAGPSTAALVALIALPGSWTSDERVAVLVISGLAMVVGYRQWDLDPIIAELPAAVEEERRRGRELVVAETERALSDSLTGLRRLAEEHRDEAPLLYELASDASCGLRAILDDDGQPVGRPLTIDAMLGPVLTLARAIGVRLEVTMQADPVGQQDAELVSWVLKDLVGNAINADATTIDALVTREGTDLVVSVDDDGGPLHSSVWKTPGTSSARLEQHLAALSGSLELGVGGGGKVVLARWSTGDDRRGLHGPETDDSGAARGRRPR